MVRRDEAVQLINRPVRDIQQFHAQVLELKKAFTVLTPVARVDSLPPMAKISFRLVDLDLRPGVGDLYDDPRFCEKGEGAFGKTALLKIMAAAGAQQLGSDRVDDGSLEYYWRWRVHVAVLDYDGTWRQVSAAKELDLRDGAPETLKPERDEQRRKTGRLVPLDATALAERRRHGAANCETKALLRALRELFALPHKVRLADLQARPIVIPKLVADLDPTDPDVKRELIQARLYGERQLHGPRPGEGSRTDVRGALRRHVERTEGRPVYLEDDDDDNPGDVHTERTACFLHGFYEGEQCQGCVEEAAARAAAETSKTSDTYQTPPVAAHGPQAVKAPQTTQAPAPNQDAPPPPLNPPEVLDEFRCGCPCDHRVEVTPELRKKSIDRIKVIRCADCYPDSGFDQKRHAKVENLGIPDYPNLTPAKVAELNARRAQR